MFPGQFLTDLSIAQTQPRPALIGPILVKQRAEKNKEKGKKKAALTLNFPLASSSCFFSACFSPTSWTPPLTPAIPVPEQNAGLTEVKARDLQAVRGSPRRSSSRNISL